ncbi:MAG: CHASE2 domain-containing protein [Syntrophobacteraceae bacterium]
MARFPKALLVGIATGLLGVGLSLAPAGLTLEERFGLPLLFFLRGTLKPPPDVLVIALDKESADRFGLPPEPARWPRSLEAALVNRLREAESAVIAFDVVFEEPRPEEQDAALEEAIEKAGNVVLCEYVKQDLITVERGAGSPAGNLALRRIVGPLPRFAKSALALAPFPLPKVPVSVNQYWLSKPELGDMPTLPVVTFQAFGLGVYDRFLELLRSLRPGDAEKLPGSREQLIKKRELPNLIRTLRDLFARDPHLAEEMSWAIKASTGWKTISDEESRVLHSLIRMYAAPDSRYLNFYGPPGSFPTLPVHQVIEPGDASLPIDLKGKAIFVGVSRHRTADQQDDFFTVFSKESGIDLTGVEIAATAFANLLEDRPVQPLPFGAHQILVLAWGTLAGGLCYRLRTRFAIPVLSVLCVAALLLAVETLKQCAGWVPVVVTLGIQSPFAFWHGLFWRHRDAVRERRNIQEAFGFFLPKNIVNQLAEDVSNLRSQSHIASGVCLCTDGEQYATLAERCSPKELIGFLNDYYETIFPVVQHHEGRVSDILGDSMLAVWTGGRAASAPSGAGLPGGPRHRPGRRILQRLAWLHAPPDAHRAELR